MVIVVHRRLGDVDAGTTGGSGVDQRLRAACVVLLDRDQDRTPLPLRAHGAPPEGRGPFGAIRITSTPRRLLSGGLHERRSAVARRSRSVQTAGDHVGQGLGRGFDLAILRQNQVDVEGGGGGGRDDDKVVDVRRG